MRCILCSSKNTTLLNYHSFELIEKLYLRYYRISLQKFFTSKLPSQIEERECKECGLHFFMPLLLPDNTFYSELSKIDNYYDPSRWDFKEALGFIKENGLFLEVGSGEGHFLRLLRNAFSESSVYCVDWNPSVSSQNTFQSLEEASKNIPKALDIIFAFQFLEHLSDPATFFSLCHKLLVSRGCIILSVPNEDSFVSRCTNNILNFPPHHFTRWTPRVFEKVGSLFGFRLKSLQYEPVSHHHLLWYQHNKIYQSILKAGSLSWCALESSRLKNWLFSFSWGLAYIFQAKPHALRGIHGHSILVRLEKLD